MSYFNRFPVIIDYEIEGKFYDLMDLTRRTGFLEEVRNNEAYSIDHYINDGETPIILADRIYDDSDLYWVIMLYNNIFDIDSEWPLDYPSMERYVERKYENPQDIHHYESISTGAVVESDWPEYDRISVRNIDYEIQLNDEKRKIKIPTPDAVEKLVKDHNRLIQQ